MDHESEEERQRRDVAQFAAFARGFDDVGDMVDESPSSHTKPEDDEHLMVTPKKGAASRKTFATDTKDTETAASIESTKVPASTSSSQPASLTLPPLDIPAIEEETATVSSIGDEDLPLFSEETILERHLVFGPIVSPRVLKEARHMLESAREEYISVHSETPRLDQLPPSVRNVVGALRVFGSGIDLESPETDNEYRGHAHLSTYQPVWGPQRAQRAIQRKRPDLVERASTAPPRLPGRKVLNGDEIDAMTSHPLGEQLNENSQFAWWLRDADDQSGSLGVSTESVSSLKSLESLVSPNVVEDGFSESLKSQNPPSDQALFTMMVQGADYSNTMSSVQLDNKGESLFNPSTFRRTSSVPGESDDDSVKEDELKTQVGISDHLSKAIASLSGNIKASVTDAPKSSRIPISMRDRQRQNYQHNYEYSGGCVPVYAADDSALPDASDLGIYETKEEQARSLELKKSQETIERFVAPDVMGTLARPYIHHSHDTRSWKAMTRSKRRSHSPDSVSVASEQTSGPYSHTRASSSVAIQSQSKKKGSPRPRKKLATRSGWWNETTDDNPESDEEGDKHKYKLSLIQRIPKDDMPTRLHPSPSFLAKQNISACHLHAATVMEQHVPYLCDRPPSHRFLQIETQAVGFSPMEKEIEPLFCTLTVYNIETVSCEPGGDLGTAPVPDLQRCGKVTETLHFDINADDTIKKRCSRAMWPYERDSDINPQDALVGTRCGVFPLPSNLNVSNLYAVLIVHKVAADESDFDPYVRVGKHIVDIEKLRTNAEKASNRHGPILMPFAFGVAPLLQVFGAENPLQPVSRAVQIPLFHFNGEERQLIDHIMVMLFPRADHKSTSVGGPAPVTNGGTAMLIMRNFGYLGLQSALDNRKSPLAKYRLVDFTCELQVRRGDRDSHHDDGGTSVSSSAQALDLVTEACVGGGRYLDHGQSTTSDPYVQELAPVPLQLTAPTRLANPRRAQNESQDAEPIFHTSFSNELLCYPRVLHGCSKKNVVIQVEIREIEWNERYGGYFMHLPNTEASIHNCRRGRYLLPKRFTTCSTRSGKRNEHHFLDEIKMKLPLDLKPRRRDGTIRTLALFFTVFQIRLGNRSKWKRTKGIFSLSGDSPEHDSHFGMTRMNEISCGFLPLSTPSCLVDNGVHTVQSIYNSSAPTPEMQEQYRLPDTSLVLVEKFQHEPYAASQKEGSLPDDANESHDSHSEKFSTSVSECYRADRSQVSDAISNVSSTGDESASRNTSKTGSHEHTSLSVRIVSLSTLHCQNAALGEFLNDEPSLPHEYAENSAAFMSLIQLNRSALSKRALVERPPHGDAREETLVKTTLALTDQHVCPLPRSAPFLFRTVPILWRQLVAGTGNPSIHWANPAHLAPLRLHSFTSILHLLGGACLYFEKNGAMELDGGSKWNMVALGRVFALLFNEEELFGLSSTEEFDTNYWCKLRKIDKAHPSSRKGRHVRSNLDLFNELQPQNEALPAPSNIVSALAGELALHTNTQFEGLLKPKSSTPESVLGTRETQAVVLTEDDQFDFQLALRTAVAAEESEDIIPTERKNSPVASSGLQGSLFHSLKGSVNGSSRRFMTMPARTSLTTIKESEDFDGSLMDHSASKTKQYRVPQLEKDIEPDKQIPIVSRTGSVASDDEIEAAGLTFIDTIGKNLARSSDSEVADEGRNVGSSNHRKTRSRSSIDWTLLASGKHQFESKQRPIKFRQPSQASLLCKDMESEIQVPTFIDRLSAMGRSCNSTARWYPYTYEVIIHQWAAILIEQGRIGRQESQLEFETFSSEDVLSQAAWRSIGLAVAAAPLLLEVIKQSLGFRIKRVFSVVLSSTGSFPCAPKIRLDEGLLAALEQIVIMVADACLDFAILDSRELMLTSVGVNDSSVLFLRDMFSFLTPNSAYRLAVSFFARFHMKDHLSLDKDSSSNYSWWVTKLRLNAISAFVRYADHLRISSPHMSHDKDWWLELNQSDHGFFDEMLSQYDLLQVSFEEDDELRPHWISEMVVDACLLGLSHGEKSIRNRSAALLEELFWNSNSESRSSGTMVPVASMYVPFIERVVAMVQIVSLNLPKSQLRRSVLLCVCFTLQSASPGLLRALWRRLCLRIEGRGQPGKLGFGHDRRMSNEQRNAISDENRSGCNGSDTSDDMGDLPDVTDLFGLLNLGVGTFEYEGPESHSDAENSPDLDTIWESEFLFSTKHEHNGVRTTSSIARKWFSHDAASIIVDTVHQVVLEMYSILQNSESCDGLLNPAVNRNQSKDLGKEDETSTSKACQCQYLDVVLFVRSAISVYLHALSLRHSDLVFMKALTLVAEAIKIFGISMFLDAVGETLQHWMRVITLHCASRRAAVRIESTDLLELILRCTWEGYGSFVRVRVPLLAVQTDVMDRLVSLSTTRYHQGNNQTDPFSIIQAEASLAPLWRTLDRIETQPASQNIGFRGALIRLARKLKMLHRAYVATRVLTMIRQPETKASSASDDARSRALRISIMRVINASSGHSKQFLGIHGAHQNHGRVAHYEAVEDALLDAAGVFSPTELPNHRVAWLRVLADFHSTRGKHAEEAMCHFQIYQTLCQAAGLHGSLWSDTPFRPWAESFSDMVSVDDCVAADAESQSGYDSEITDAFIRDIDSASTFRRVLHGAVRTSSNGLLQRAKGTPLFNGVALEDEYQRVLPWLPLKAIEEKLVRASEVSGEIFLRAGIVENCRAAWSLATQYHAEKFNSAKLARAYQNLSRAIVSQVPRMDSSSSHEMSTLLGRFYRVWFHGGAPDELNGIEFVYRVADSVSLDDFGASLRSIISSIIPDSRPIHLMLDGKMSQSHEESSVPSFGRVGPIALQPVKLKVTPLRPIFAQDEVSRGVPEWFYQYVDEAFRAEYHASTNLKRPRLGREYLDPHQREHSRSFSTSVFSSRMAQYPLTSTETSGKTRLRGNSGPLSSPQALTGVDRFCFLQPIDRTRSPKEWWKDSVDADKKSLKVIQLQVAHCFPSCVTRQAVVHRLVYSISPVEAGVDTMCQWCSLLFRTVVATVGQSVLGKNADPGIGTTATKVVAESIHSSQVKDITVALLGKGEGKLDETDEAYRFEYDYLSRDESNRLKLKFARLVIVFLELLHILVARNRDGLLVVVQERKKSDTSSSRGRGRGASRTRQRDSSIGSYSSQTDTRNQRREASLGRSSKRSILQHRRSATDDSDAKKMMNPENSVHSNLSSGGLRTDSAIAVQSELQRAFTSLTKSLFPYLQEALDGNTPRWLHQCKKDNHFSTGVYSKTKIPIAEELGIKYEAPTSSGNDMSASGSVQSSASKGSELYGVGHC